MQTTQRLTPRSSTPTEYQVGEDGLIYGLRPPQPAGFRPGDHPRIVGAIAVAVFLIAWQLYGASINPIFLATPSAVAAAFVELVQSGELWAAILKSLQGLAIGFALAIVAGIILGILMGRYRTINAIFDPFVTLLYATPIVALIPLIMLWFGLNLEAKVVIIFESCFFPIVINTLAGVRNVSRSMVDVARAYGASDQQVMTQGGAAKLGAVCHGRHPSGGGSGCGGHGGGRVLHRAERTRVDDHRVPELVCHGQAVRAGDHDFGHGPGADRRRAVAGAAASAVERVRARGLRVQSTRTPRSGTRAATTWSFSDFD